MRSNFFTYLLHAALAIIIVGACVTHFLGEQGEIHLRYDKASSLSTKHSTLSLFLWDFNVLYDGDNPKDYISELRLLDRSCQPLVVDTGIVRMNKPLKYHGYRFCQSDYDSDERGVVLSYNYDPWGTGITYTGYALLLIAMVGFFFQRNTYFRAFIRKQHKILMVVLAMVVIALSIVMTHVVTPKPPLLPVLQTPLLGIHVSVIMIAYTLFAAIMVCGIIGLSSKKLSVNMFQLSNILLSPAVFCLAAGIFIGAVWANMSWGRYWGWDPKETWALITMLVYAGLLHFHKSQTPYHIFSIIAFVFVLFTYFGVKYLLGGLHAYA